MKLSLNWLREFIDIPSKHTGADIGKLLTLHTAEVESIEDEAQAYEKMRVGKVLKIRPHPNADKLRLVDVDIGKEQTVQMVCGGKNLYMNMLVAIALPGAKVRWHGEGDLAELTEAKIRGENSHGMICAGEEIGLDPDNTPTSTEIHIKNLSSLKAKPGTPLSEALKKNDVVFDIDNKSLTHRPDLWSHHGMARELSVIFKKPLKKSKALFNFKAKTPAKGALKINIKDQEICPRFSACTVSGVKITESPQWIKSLLQTVDIRPINNVVDVTNYVMLELGQPMHAYDCELVGNTLEVRYAKKGESLETIDHKKRPLHEQDPMVANAKGPLGVAGIMGGANSEIREATTEVILEAANWNPQIIRKCSMRHGLRSEASQRFEKGLDPHLTERAVHRAIVLLEETCPNLQLMSPITTVGDWQPSSLKIKFRPETTRSKIGLNLSNTEMIRILKTLDFKVTPKGKIWEVTVPSHRATGDVKIEDDLVEEIARIYGYNEIPDQLPALPICLPLENEERIHKHDARRILAYQLGFTEALNYSFYSEEDFHRAGLQSLRHIRVKNALSNEQTHMRVSLVPGVLKNIAKNGREHAQMKLFEIGRTYKETGEFMPLEEKWIVTAIAYPPSKNEIFYDAKGALESFLKKFRTPNVFLKECTTPPAYAHPKKTVEIVACGEPIGYVFTLHPSVARAFDIEHDVGCFELNFTKLVSQGRKTAQFKELPKFPNMPFDVSLIIERKKSVAEVERTIRSGDPHSLIHSVKLFDTYEGPNIPQGKKSLAFTIELRHNDHTLSDKEFQETQRAVFEAIEKIGGQVRKG